MSGQGGKRPPPPSHSEVLCKQCKIKIQKRNLADHYLRYHEGKNHKECLVAEKGNIDSFFTKPFAPSDESGESSSKKQKEATETFLIPNPSTSNAEMESIMSDISKLKEGQAKILTAIQDKQQKPMTAPKPKPNDIDYDLLKSNNVDELVANVDWLILTDDNQYARCIVCMSGNKPGEDGQSGFFNLSQEFRYLKKHIKGHSNRELHCQKLADSEMASLKSTKVAKRSDQVGMRLGTIAYQIMYHGEALTSYERKVAALSMNGVDVGNINHSKNFPIALISPFKNIVSSKLKLIVKSPLPCTDEGPPIALIDDKSKIKHEERHGIMTRFPVLKNGRFFQTFLLGQPVQEKGNQEAMMETLIKITQDELDLSISDIRQQLVCHVADGAIAKNLHIHKSHANKLQLDESYVKTVVLWDAAHRLELAAEDTKVKTPWLRNFDSKLEAMMVEMKQDLNRNSLIQTATEMDLIYYELHLFSDTRFIQYAHRTYRNIREMWPVINRVLESQSASDTSKAIDVQKGHKVFLQDPISVLRLIFMEEVANILTVLSKEFQKCDDFPYHAKQASEKTVKSTKGRINFFQKLKTSKSRLSIRIFMDSMEVICKYSI